MYCAPATGQAPEEHVIKSYDINDYKEKTELTHNKLITVFYSSLRAYRDIMQLENARGGLRRAIYAISEVYDSHNLRRFASAVLEQVNYLLNMNGNGLCASRVNLCRVFGRWASQGSCGYRGLLLSAY